MLKHSSNIDPSKHKPKPTYSAKANAAHKCFYFCIEFKQSYKEYAAFVVDVSLFFMFVERYAGRSVCWLVGRLIGWMDGGWIRYIVDVEEKSI